VAYSPLDVLHDSVDVLVLCAHPNRLVSSLRFHPRSSEGLPGAEHHSSAPRARQRRQLFYAEVCRHVPTHLPTCAHPVMPHKLGDWHTRRGTDRSQVATAFCVPIRLTVPSCDPSLVGERTRRFGHRRDVSIYHRSHPHHRTYPR
jgi:hypothetical protein